MKNGGEDGSLGARAAVYRGAAVLVGAEDGAARNGILGARAAVYRGAAVLSQRGAAILSQRRAGGRKERRRRGGLDRRNLATPTPEGGEFGRKQIGGKARGQGTAAAEARHG